jgi:hypothetical protein
MSGIQPSSDSFGAVTQADGLGWYNGAPLALSFAGADGRFQPESRFGWELSRFMRMPCFAPCIALADRLLAGFGLADRCRGNAEEADVQFGFGDEIGQMHLKVVRIEPFDRAG